MRKFLLTTSALVGLALVAGQANAQALDVTVGGKVEYEMGFFDADLGAGVEENDTDARTDAEIVVGGEAVSDSGLTYGAKIKLTSESSDFGSEEAFLYVESAYGKVVLGDDYHVPAYLGVVAPTVGFGQIDSEYYDFAGVETLLVPFNVDSNSTIFTTASYLTPVFSGFQAGVSYSAEAQKGFGVVVAEPANGLENLLSAAARYDYEFSNSVALALGGSYIRAEQYNQAFEDVSSWQLGANVAYQGFTFGGGYVSSDEIVDNVDQSALTEYSLGLTYENGPYAVGGSYASLDDSEENATVYGFGGQYDIAPGLYVQADLNFFDVDENFTQATATANNLSLSGGDDGYVFILGAGVAM